MEISEDLKKLEEKVMELLLAGDHPTLRVLYQQWKKSTIKKVELTGVGFFIGYEVSSEATVVSGAPSFSFGDVYVELSGLKDPTGYVLFIENGKLTTLEGYITDKSWPEKVEIQKIYYIGGLERNWENVRKDLPV